MHEYALIQSLVERVEAEARARDASRVHRLSVRIGEQSGVDIELFRTAFMTFRERSVCADAELEIEAVPAIWQCARCQRLIAAGEVLRCPRCDRPARLASGDDIMLERIEMEVPDV